MSEALHTYSTSIVLARNKKKNSLEVLTLLVDVAFVRALPRHVHGRPPTLVQGDEKVGAGVPERQGHVRRHHLSLRRLPFHTVVASHRVQSLWAAGGGVGGADETAAEESGG